MPKMDDVYARRADVMARDTPDGAVLVDIVSGDCWELNKVGAVFWSLLDGPTTLNRACEALLSRYNVPRHELERDILALTAELSKAGLVSVRGPVGDDGTR